MSLNLGLIDVSSRLYIQVLCFGWEYYRNGVVFFWAHHIRRHMEFICSVTSDVNLDHLVKMVSARFLHHEIIIL